MQRVRSVVLVCLFLGLAASAVAQISDTSAPTLVSFSLDTTDVDLTSGPATINVSAHITDDLAGLWYAYVQVSGPNGQSQTAYLSRITGDELDGDYTGQLMIPGFAAPGTWNITVNAVDFTGNSAFIDTPTLASLGFVSAILVTNPNPDVTPPTVTALTLTPSTVDVSAGSATITARAHLTDDLSGAVFVGQFNTFALTLVSPNLAGHAQKVYVSSAEFNLISGSEFDGDWEASFVLPQMSAPGNWTVESLTFTDQAGNTSFLNTLLLNDLGIPTIFPVTDTSPDTTQPMLTGFSVSPAVADTSLSPQTFTFTISAQDNPAGVNWNPTTTSIAFIQLGVTSPSGQQSQYFNPFVPPVRTAGTDQAGTWQLPIQLPRFAEAGTWKVSFFTLKDAVDNELFLDAAALESRGFQPSFVVTKPSQEKDGNVSSGGGIVNDEVFGNKASVTFPPGLVSGPTDVAIDVFPDPLALPDPRGFTGAATYFVNFAFTPRPPSPLPPPGLTIVLPLRNPMATNTPISLYHLDPVTGTLAPARNYLGGVVVGKVNADGLSATFLNVVTLSTLVGYVSDGSLLGDINGDNKVDCTDMSTVRASFGARKGQAKYNPLADVNNDNVVDVKDLLVVSKQLPPKTVCK